MNLIAVMSNEINHFYEFGNFRFSAREKCLWRGEELIQLSPNSLEVLDLLLKNHQNVVSREEIIEKVWKDTFVDEANLTVAISNLRKEFGKDSSKKFIQTVPKKGYRFIADVEKVFEENKSFENENEIDTAREEIRELPKSTIPEKSPVRWHFVAIILLGVFLLTSFGLWVNFGDEKGLSSVPTNERDIKSVAVLPLKNLSEDQENKTLSLGITDSLISRLGKLNRFAVRPLSAVEDFPESEKDALGFGEELKVDAVLVGTIQSSNERLRVNVRLLDVRDGAQIWSKSYDEVSVDIFRLQDDLSLQVAANLIAQISNEDNQKLTVHETENKEAFEEYSKGRFYLAKRTKEGIEKAIEHFENAVKLDQSYSRAYVGIAEGYLLLSDSTFAYYEPLKFTSEIGNAIDKALELDPNSAEAYNSKGALKTWIEWDIEAALENYEKSISINPNIAQTHHWYAWTLLAQKRFDEAEREMKLARELDPTSLIIAVESGLPILYAGKFEESITYFQKAVELDKNFYQARFRLWYAFYLSGKYDEAFEQLEVIKNVTSADDRFYQGLYAMTLAKTGDRVRALEIQKDLEKRRAEGEYITPLILASLALILEDKNSAFKWFDEGFRERNDYMLYLEIAPEYKELQTDERFKKLLERIDSV